MVKNSLKLLAVLAISAIYVSASAYTVRVKNCAKHKDHHNIPVVVYFYAFGCDVKGLPDLCHYKYLPMHGDSAVFTFGELTSNQRVRIASHDGDKPWFPSAAEFKPGGNGKKGAMKYERNARVSDDGKEKDAQWKFSQGEC